MKEFFNDELVTITINSPMGAAIYKKKVGDVVTYKVRNNEFTAMIISKEKVLEKQAVNLYNINIL